MCAIAHAEKLHRERSVKDFSGFMTLLDATQDFALQTFDEAQRHGHILNVFGFAFVGASWRRLRVALNEFYSGYYNDATSNLRSVFESVLYLAAVAHGYIRFDALLEAAHRLDFTRASEAERLQVERDVQRETDGTIKRKMRGKESGLSKDDQHELELMFIVLHAHVHKASSTIIDFIGEMMADHRVPSIAPTFNELQASRFANAAVCIAWAFMRVLPCLSLPSRFSQDWQKRQGVLEDSFHFYLDAWDKPLGPAFMRFMVMKMTFTDESFKKFEVDRETTMVVTAKAQ